MTWTESPFVVRFRERSRVVDVIIETVAGWRLHAMGRNAALMTYYGFLSIFPLFLVATTILGIVLENNESLREKILDTAISQIPVIGEEIQRNAGTIEGTATASLAVGFLIALWAATRAFVGVQRGFDDAWEVPLDRRSNIAKLRLRALLGIVIIGASLIAAVAVTTIVSVTDFPLITQILLFAATWAIYVTVLAAMYRVLTSARLGWRDTIAGALLGGSGFTALQIVGAWFITRFITNASDTNGVFATVFALLAWISMHAMLTMFGAELNAAIARRREGRYATTVSASMQPARLAG
ncbi:MAG TPA: YihY/virulence factor BrkB family protein [Ilumatobacteraceae bacterium]